MKFKGLTTGLACGLAAIATSYAVLLGINNAVSNYEYKSKDGWYHSVKRAYGAFGSTDYKQYRNGSYKADSVYISRPKFPKMWFSFYDDGGIDGPHDGLVDRISIYEENFLNEIFGGKKNTVLERDKHFYSHRAEFEKADKTLAQTKERFQKFFK